MSEQLYNRSATLTIAKPVASAYFNFQNAVVIKDLRVAFSIEKHLKSDPNTCNVTIYNLNSVSRALFQTKPLHVTLDVGYGGNLTRIFTGDLRWGVSKLESPDWVTTLELADGDRAINYARVKATLPAGATRLTALETAAKAAGLKIPKNLKEAKELLQSYVNGISLTGSATRAMTAILNPKGMDWSIQDSSLQVLKKREVRTDQAIEINERNGMIESPEMSPPGKSQGGARLTVKTLMDSRLKPGVQVILDSLTIKGQFKADRIVHEGDTHGVVWNTTVEAIPL